MSIHSRVYCHFRIYTFRNIVDTGWFRLGPRVCMIGANGAGKTSVLDALHAFTWGGPALEEKPLFSIEEHKAFADLVTRVRRPKGPDLQLLIRRKRTGECVAYARVPDYGEGMKWAASELQRITDGANPDDLFNFGWNALHFRDSDKGLMGYIKKQATAHNKKLITNDQGQNAATAWQQNFSDPDQVVTKLKEGCVSVTGWGEPLQGNAIVPSFLRVPDDLHLGDQVSRSEILSSKNAESLKSLSHLSEGRPDGPLITSLLLGAIYQGAGDIKHLPDTDLDAVGLTQLSLNGLIRAYWEPKTTMNISPGQKWSMTALPWSETYDIQLLQNGERPRSVSLLSRGGNWFFGFLAFALAARALAKRHNQGESAAYLPFMLLLDEPATFLHVNRQYTWLDLIDDLSEPLQCGRSGGRNSRAGTPWFGFSTHSPTLVRRDRQIVLAIDLLDRERDGINVQNASTVVHGPDRIESRERYQLLLASLRTADAVIGSPVVRLVLEGISDREILQAVLEAVLSPGSRPRLHTVVLDGVARLRLGSWPRFRDHQLRDELWVSGTSQLITLFDGDEEGRRATSEFPDLVRHFFAEDGGKCPWKISGLTMDKLCGIATGTAEDLLPRATLHDFLGNCHDEGTSLADEDQPVAVVLRQHATDTGRNQSDLKAAYQHHCLKVLGIDRLRKMYDQETELRDMLREQLPRISQ